ncbi:MAG: ATP synthase gamma chain [Brockia lithotrophica]|uniref:ATP synthase gamma chain n=1 Tax=Brockia lithotrophica TaxID=933949 RepID=A0A2T5GAX5_9BACL|nr:ATP synthase F1 subunit gamma [Brockia lithotrophica]PTQ53331.1 MAG: ATP synthase gamma chain [Brockia lithotrophica]
MAKGLRELRQRIRSLKKTQQITHTMELISASRLRHAQERALLAKPYAQELRRTIASVMRGLEARPDYGELVARQPLLVQRPVERTAYLLITSDRGLAGAYNANLIRFLLRTLEERHGGDRSRFVLIAVGRKGRDFFRRRGFPVVKEVTGLSDFPRYEDVQEIAKGAVQAFAEGVYDELVLVYNAFHSALVQRPTAVTLLPLGKGLFQTQGDASEEASGGESEYEFEPSPDAVLQVLLPRYAEALIFSAVLEAKAGEHASRMAAMRSATDNAKEIIRTTTIRMNRARQAAITQEISEVMAGAEALKG